MLKLSSMKQSSQYPIPEPIQSKLSELRGMISRLIACQGIVVLATWLLLSFLFFGLLDYLPARFGADESPRFVRILMLAIMGAGTLAIFYHFFWNRWLVRWSDSSLALAIERQHPEFQSTLITTVQAAASSLKVKQTGPKHAPDRRGKVTDTDVLHETDHPSRGGLLEIASEQAIQRIRNIDIKSLIRFRIEPIRRCRRPRQRCPAPGSRLDVAMGQKAFRAIRCPMASYNAIGRDGTRTGSPSLHRKSEARSILDPIPR